MILTQEYPDLAEFFRRVALFSKKCFFSSLLWILQLIFQCDLFSGKYDKCPQDTCRMLRQTVLISYSLAAQRAFKESGRNTLILRTAVIVPLAKFAGFGWIKAINILYDTTCQPQHTHRKKVCKHFGSVGSLKGLQS